MIAQSPSGCAADETPGVDPLGSDRGSCCSCASCNGALRAVNVDGRGKSGETGGAIRGLSQFVIGQCCTAKRRSSTRNVSIMDSDAESNEAVRIGEMR